MSVQIVKLVTGEIVISDLVFQPQGTFKLNHPVTIRMYPSTIAGGQPSLGFAPWPEFGIETSVDVEPLHVAYRYKPNPEIEGEYNRMMAEINGQEAPSYSGIITG